jgi:hypothetical protein
VAADANILEIIQWLRTAYWLMNIRRIATRNVQVNRNNLNKFDQFWGWRIVAENKRRN